MNRTFKIGDRTATLINSMMKLDEIFQDTKRALAGSDADNESDFYADLGKARSGLEEIICEVIADAIMQQNVLTKKEIEI